MEKMETLEENLGCEQIDKIQVMDIKNPIIRKIVREEYDRGLSEMNPDLVCYGDAWDRHAKYSKFT